MRHILFATAAISMALGAPALAQGNGKGKDKPAASANHKVQKHSGKTGNKNAKAARKAIDRPDKGKSAKAQARKAGEKAYTGKSIKNNGKKNAANPASGRAARDGKDVRDIFYVREDGRFRFGKGYGDYDRRYALNDCPPGLAKKRNGCLPPGQAKKLGRDPASRYLGYYPRFRDGNYYYSNGYAYRIDTGSKLANAILPLVGGALFGGKQWPSAYDNYRVPTYYQSYYGRGDDYGYRYADRTIFRVDPKDQAIMGIAGLLTGNDFEVGRAMPVGYDVYNVPYRYRDQYRDTPEAHYRYSDGYVYRIDPKTRLVAAAIELLI